MAKYFGDIGQFENAYKTLNEAEVLVELGDEDKWAETMALIQKDKAELEEKRLSKTLLNEVKEMAKGGEALWPTFTSVENQSDEFVDN